MLRYILLVAISMPTGCSPDLSKCPAIQYPEGTTAQELAAAEISCSFRKMCTAWVRPPIMGDGPVFECKEVPTTNERSGDES